MQNATYLFKHPNSYMKNSESRWTAVAQMSLIYLSTLVTGFSLPVYESDKDGYLTPHSNKHDLLISGFTCSNTVCECRLSNGVFDEIESEIDKDNNKYLSNIKPDILHIDVPNKKVVLIEVKTVGESVERNMELYNKLENYLRDKNWNCELFYLLSHGHENKLPDWPWLSGDNSKLPGIKSKIILWEDLFGKMSKSPISNLIGDNLSCFCERPAHKPV